jgi:hypothetical protein
MSVKNAKLFHLHYGKVWAWARQRYTFVFRKTEILVMAVQASWSPPNPALSRPGVAGVERVAICSSWIG